LKSPTSHTNICTIPTGSSCSSLEVPLSPTGCESGGSSEFGFGSQIEGTPEPMEYMQKPVIPQGSQPVGERGTSRLEHEDPVGMVQMFVWDVGLFN
jgi:hypothetical protein